MNSPTVTIITVVFNARDLLETTLNSVFGQTYPHIEFIVVDGGSKDGTADLIRVHADRIAKWVSEPDRGLYDAMNKGLRMATGDFVWFLNAGDRIFSPGTLDRIMSLCTPTTDVLFGEVMLVDDQRRHLGTRSELTAQKLPAQLTWKSLRLGMVVCHQAILVRRSISPFFIENNLTADIDWVINALRQSRETLPTGLILAEYLQGGISKQRHRRSLADRFRILKKHYGFWPNVAGHLVILLRAVVHRIRRINKERY